MARYVTINTKVKKIVRRGAPGPVSSTPDPTFDSVTLNTAASPPAAPVQAQMWWDADEETYSMKQDGTTLQFGQETQYNVRNNTGSTITNGTPVMATGSLGASGRITIAEMDGTDPDNAKLLLGIATEDIEAGTDGKVTNFGKNRGLDTSGTPEGETWIDGNLLWISDAASGTLTNIEPDRAKLGMPVAFVVYAHASNGTIFVRITSLDEHLLVTPDQRDALDSANAPTELNPIATIADVGGGGGGAVELIGKFVATGAESSILFSTLADGLYRYIIDVPVASSVEISALFNGDASVDANYTGGQAIVLSTAGAAYAASKSFVTQEAMSVSWVYSNHAGDIRAVSGDIYCDGVSTMYGRNSTLGVYPAFTSSKRTGLATITDIEFRGSAVFNTGTVFKLYKIQDTI